jgi:hypothetical protein
MITAGLQKLGVIGVWGGLVLVLMMPDPEASKPNIKTPPPPSKSAPKARQIVAAVNITLPPPPASSAALPMVKISKVKTSLEKKEKISPVKRNLLPQKPSPKTVKIKPLPKSSNQLRNESKVVVKALAKSLPKRIKPKPVKILVPVKPLRSKIKKPAVPKPVFNVDAHKKETSPPDVKKVTLTPKRDGAAVREGGVLLRLLEHGAGPTVEIAWPSGMSARNRLYETLRHCHGMRVAVFVQDRGLFLADSAPRQAQTLDTDRYSGFVRQSQGSVITAEARIAQQIRQRHSLAFRGGFVRLFPRSEDALLLGGLSTLTGKGYQDAHTIRAIYRHEGNRLYIENITMDRQDVEGRIDLLTGSCR